MTVPNYQKSKGLIAQQVLLLYGFMIFYHYPAFLCCVEMKLNFQGMQMLMGDLTQKEFWVIYLMGLGKEMPESVTKKDLTRYANWLKFIQSTFIKMWQSCLILCFLTFLLQRVLLGCKKLSQKIASVTIPGHEQNHICPLQNWVEEDSYPIVDASTLKKDIECGDIIEECRKIIHPPDIFTKPKGKYSSWSKKNPKS